jgi:site-specific DNA recombinase
MGVEIDAWHDDQDYSGGNVDRPAFLEVIRRIETGETGGVIVARIDRFARSAPDGGAMVRRILDAGGIFASAQERIDPTTDFGKPMLNIMFVMAELQLDQLKSGWKTAKGRAIGRGAHIGPTPIGYRRLPRGQEGSGKLVPDPGSAPAVTKLFRRAAAGIGVSELARYMDEIAPRTDGGLDDVIDRSPADQSRLSRRGRLWLERPASPQPARARAAHRRRCVARGPA